MFELFKTMFGGLISSSAKKILVGSGLTMVNAAGTFILIRFLIDKIDDSMNNANADLLSFISLCGLDTYMSIITGAIVAAVTLDKAKIKLSKE